MNQMWIKKIDTGKVIFCFKIYFRLKKIQNIYYLMLYKLQDLIKGHNAHKRNQSL